MSKERARRREAREREAAERAAARETAVRRAARRRAVIEPVAGPLRRMRGSAGTGRQTGVLADRRRKRTGLIFAALFLIQVLIWIARPDWQARLAALVLTALAVPVIAVFAL